MCCEKADAPPYRKPQPEPVPKPRMVLRIGFAGKRSLLPDRDDKGNELTGEAKKKRDEKEAKMFRSVEGRLEMVLQTIGKQLVELAPHTECQHGDPPTICEYYRDQDPLLRLVTGLCEGADQLAFQAMERLSIPCLETENGLVIGFDKESYRQSRDSKFLPEFDREVETAAYLLEGDGVMEPKSNKQSPSEKEQAEKRRSRGYRLQSDLLLRQSDLLIAVVDPESKGKAGGSLETIRKALAFQLPVVLIRPSGEGIQVLEPDENLADQLENPHEEDWPTQLEERVTKIVADPDLSENAYGEEQHGKKLLDEFFSGVQPAKSHSLFTWKWFLNRFKTRLERQKEEAERHQGGAAKQIEPTYQGQGLYGDYRGRASSLAGNYAAKYRNLFFSNSVYAWLAVVMATVSLLLLSQHLAHPSPGLLILLIALATWKLGLVVAIYRNSHRANHDHWNDRTVDYRYLAERLRQMKYLPQVRIWQPPAAAPPQYASRVVRQSAVDWLFDAIIRAASPAGWGNTEKVIVAPAKNEVLSLLERVRTAWLEDQERYHRRNCRYLSRMSEWLENSGILLNVAVMFVVVADIALLIAKSSGASLGSIKPLTPWIVLVTALVPAAVASVNLVRFQSECRRLAERSAVLVQILGGRRPGDKEGASGRGAHHDPSGTWGRIATWCADLRKTFLAWLDRNGEYWPPKVEKNQNPRRGGQIQKAKLLEARLQDDKDGAYLGRVMHFTENSAEIFVQEVAEWSVLYAQDLVEP